MKGGWRPTLVAKEMGAAPSHHERDTDSHRVPMKDADDHLAPI